MKASCLSDAIVRVDVNKEGNVKFTPISLTGQKLEPIENYNIKYWEDFFKEEDIKPSKAQIVVTKILKVIRHKYFWMGALASLFCLTLLAVFLYLHKNI